jgi:hypothetical protein
MIVSVCLICGREYGRVCEPHRPERRESHGCCPRERCWALLQRQMGLPVEPRRRRGYTEGTPCCRP